ncbi:hypothetical protein niasHT_034209 [Heterodera trifolii]|uniref:Protein kinase domain-containing protein n=1 Tax=Heterodera trifolii TaxID=157864 RepID=A0ABD2J2M7_9BILA
MNAKMSNSPRATARASIACDTRAALMALTPRQHSQPRAGSADKVPPPLPAEVESALNGRSIHNSSPRFSAAVAAVPLRQQSMQQQNTNSKRSSTCSSSSMTLPTNGGAMPPSSPISPSSAAAHRPMQMPPPGGTPLDAHLNSIQSAGFIVGGHWHHFLAQSNMAQDNEKDVSLFLFDKKCNVKGPTRIGRISRLSLVDLLRYDLNQLQQLQHPRILRMVKPLTESKDLLAFATEPVQCTLDKLYEHFEPEDAGGPLLEKLEMKRGILQLIEGLSYLHNNAKMLHGNLTPQAVFIAAKQFWKIGGFAFSVASKKANVFPCFPWTKKFPPCLQPDLDFLAPEYLAPNTQTVSTAADVFSLGALICWIYGGGRRLIDVSNNLESHQIVIDQLDVALEMLTDELGPNLKGSLAKVLSKDVEQRPAVQMLALTKHFDDPALCALRQLDDLAQNFDPASKAAFLGQTLGTVLAQIPEPLWFRIILRRFDEHLTDASELFPALLRPLSQMLQHCESHNIHRLRPWFRRICGKTDEKQVCHALLDQLPVIFRRLNDEQVEDRCFDMLIHLLQGLDPHLKQSAVRSIPQIAEFVPAWFVNKRLIPVLQCQAPFFQEHIPRQIDLLVAVAHLSDRCDAQTLHYLLTVASVCSTLHPAIVHSKSRLVQRILTCDVSRLRDPLVIAHHLLNPLVLGLALPELSPAHFDDVMSSSRILLDIVEQLRYEFDDSRMKAENGGGSHRLCNRRVSMSSNHLPRLLITAARPSIGDGRKMSFLSADGRLEDRRGSRRESKDSRCSLESEVSLRICNGSDVSDESAVVCPNGAAAGGTASAGGGRQTKARRKSWLEHGYMHSVSLEQSVTPQVPPQSSHPLPFATAPHQKQRGIARVDVARCSSAAAGTANGQQMHTAPAQTNAAEQRPFSTVSRKMTTGFSAAAGGIPCGIAAGSAARRNRSPEGANLLDETGGRKPSRPNSFTNLGHNLACTLWKTFY